MVFIQTDPNASSILIYIEIDLISMRPNTDAIIDMSNFVCNDDPVSAQTLFVCVIHFLSGLVGSLTSKYED